MTNFNGRVVPDQSIELMTFYYQSGTHPTDLLGPLQFCKAYEPCSQKSCKITCSQLCIISAHTTLPLQNHPKEWLLSKGYWLSEIKEEILQPWQIRSNDHKTLFLLNLAEHEVYLANKFLLAELILCSTLFRRGKKLKLLVYISGINFLLN